MTLTMNAAPLSMAHAGHHVQTSAAVLQAHFALMYLPSFVNPLIVKRVGVRGLIVAGVAASGLGCVLTAVAAQTLPVYVLELGMSGIGWNFIFNGGTLLLTGTYPAALRTRAQGVNSLIVYCANVLASFSAGALVATLGWAAVNLACLPILALALVALRRGGRLPWGRKPGAHG
jgi:MFS family permease